MEQTVARTETRDRIADAVRSNFLGKKDTVYHLLSVSLCQEQRGSGYCDLLCLIPAPVIDICISRMGTPWCSQNIRLQHRAKRVLGHHLCNSMEI